MRFLFFSSLFSSVSFWPSRRRAAQSPRALGIVVPFDPPFPTSRSSKAFLSAPAPRARRSPAAAFESGCTFAPGGRARSARKRASVDAFFSKKTVGSKKMPPSLLQQTHSGPRPDRRQCRPDCRGQEHVAQRPSGAQERLGRLHAQVSGQRKGEREGSSFFQWFRRHRRGIRRAAAAGSSFFVFFFFSFRHS